MKGEPNPYRFFFTLGWILASVGVLLWPLFHFRLITTYPNVLHARIMIQGFVACHMFGFLCTALPQILETIPFTRLETVLSAIGLTAVVILHSLKQTVWADALFALVLAVFIVRAAWRGTIRLCMPPPGMVSVGIGFLSAIVGSVLQALYMTHSLPAYTYNLSRLLLYQGFPLLPILGIGAFILPVFIGYPRRIVIPPARNPSRVWLREATIHLLTSTFFIASFVIEALGQTQLGYALRAATLIGFLIRYIPVYRTHEREGTLVWFKRLSFIAMALGLILAVPWPNHYLAWLHIVFITGYGLLIMGVASRVILAHGGKLALTFRQSPFLWIAYALLVLAMLTRVTADWIPARKFSHYAYAGIAWVVAVAMWGGYILRQLHKPIDS